MGSGVLWDSISTEAKDFIRSLIKADPKNRLPITQVVDHPWFKMQKEEPLDLGTSVEILDNLRRFSNTSVFAATCIAAVSRQLDHRRLQNIYKIFLQMDKYRDGVLSIQEVTA